MFEAEAFIEFLAQNKLKFLTLHILGTALGLGGATISDIMFFKFLKDFRISKKEQEVLHVLKNVVLGALGVIVLSGVALYLPMAEQLNTSGPFLVKTIGVIVLTINGIALHAYIAPHLIHLNLKQHKTMGRTWHRIAFALGAISVVSWYTVFLIAMLKTLMTWTFSELLGMYVMLLIFGIIGSQMLEWGLSKQAKR